MTISRRSFLATSGAGLGAGLLDVAVMPAQIPGERPAKAVGIRVLNPRGRVPVSFIIDDSTCLVNLAHFCIPHFAEAFPDRYLQDWRRLPREIPDRFVRKFAGWCREHGVKGKYSVIPYPACVGWLDRDIPGWSRRELAQSLDLLRTDLAADWDFHPEMITHTWAIDTKTGRPYPDRTERFMENWGWSVGRSTDEIADYLGYALRVLKSAGISCNGITTPGGFGNRVLPQLAQATLQSCRDVFGTEIPHYFRHLYTDLRSVAPRVEYAAGLNGPHPHCVVSIIGCTGDWFGGWDGLERGSVDRFITANGNGRLPEVIRRGEPAVLVSHWPGIYFNGEEYGFTVFKEVVRRLHQQFDNLLWLKLSDIARYWAAKELTTITRHGPRLTFNAPFAAPDFTLAIDNLDAAPQPRLAVAGGVANRLNRVDRRRQLTANTWFVEKEQIVCCFNLTRGQMALEL